MEMSDGHLVFFYDYSLLDKKNIFRFDFLFEDLAMMMGSFV